MSEALALLDRSLPKKPTPEILQKRHGWIVRLRSAAARNPKSQRHRELERATASSSTEIANNDLETEAHYAGASPAADPPCPNQHLMIQRGMASAGPWIAAGHRGGVVANRWCCSCAPDASSQHYPRRRRRRREL
jgi:hypothetical protein